MIDLVFSGVAGGGDSVLDHSTPEQDTQPVSNILKENCRNCGAPVKGDACDYCQTVHTQEKSQ